MEIDLGAFAVKRPRAATVRSIVVARIAAAYSPGSAKIWTWLKGIICPISSANLAFGYSLSAN
jgi:hypothetical protein